MPARSIKTRDINRLLGAVAATGVSARAVNKTRIIIAAAFNYGMRESAFGLPSNPALAADVRREPHPGVLCTTRRRRSNRSRRLWDQAFDEQILRSEALIDLLGMSRTQS
ncbi:MAG TPA: hypothetical protein VLP43_11595 [Solirubrobacteraceae bacterium]|nr:hypothetical protein [Solirubrobacteraceae bacterium]